MSKNNNHQPEKKGQNGPTEKSSQEQSTKSTSITKEKLLKMLKNPRYEVGFGRPPTKSQFKPGQSGNPNGRPRGSRNKLKPDQIDPLANQLLKDILKLANTEITVTENGVAKPSTIYEGVWKKVASKALKGDHRSQKLFIEKSDLAEAQRVKDKQKLFETLITYKEEWNSELKRREQTGETGPEPFIHPDQIVADIRSGQVYLTGPLTEEEKKDYDNLTDRIALFEKDLELIEQEIREASSDEDLAECEKNIKYTISCINQIKHMQTLSYGIREIPQ